MMVDSERFVRVFLEMLQKIIIIAGGTCLGMLTAIRIVEWWDDEE